MSYLPPVVNKGCSCLIYLQLLIRGAHVLFTFFVFVYSGVQHILTISCILVTWWVFYKRQELFVLRGGLVRFV